MILWNYITESSLWKDPRDAWDVTGAPWDLGDPLGTPLGPLGTSLGPHGTPGHAPGTPGHAPGTLWHAPGTPRDVPETPPGTPLGPPGTPMGRLWEPLWTTKSVISRQIDTARSSRLLCWNLPMGAQHDSPSPSRPRNWPIAKKLGGHKRGLYSESVRGL